jgi:hypothetical protein
MDLLRNDPGQQDVEPDGGQLRRELQPRRPITGHREGGYEQWKQRNESADRKSGKEGKSEPTGGRHGEDRQRQPVSPLEEKRSGERANQEKSKKSPGDDGRR